MCDQFNTLVAIGFASGECAYLLCGIIDARREKAPGAEATATRGEATLRHYRRWPGCAFVGLLEAHLLIIQAFAIQHFEGNIPHTSEQPVSCRPRGKPVA